MNKKIVRNYAVLAESEVLVATGSAAGVVLIFGIYPAWRAVGFAMLFTGNCLM